VEIQEDVLVKYPYRPSEIREVLHEDGSIAEK
jgi:hypothetical protein